MNMGKQWWASLFCWLLFCSHCLMAQSGKPLPKRSRPSLKVSQDGFPSGPTSPEGAACDLARAFIKHNVTLFKATCIKPYGGEPNRHDYAVFLQQVTQSMALESRQAKPSAGGPKSIGKVFAARHLSLDGPASSGYALFGFKNVEFVDVGVFLHNGQPALNRTLVIQAADGKWYVHPLPSAAPLLSAGLNQEKPSTQDFSTAYTVVKPTNAVNH